MPGPTDPLAARLLAELEPEVNRSGRQLLLGLGDDQRTQTERIEATLARRSTGWWSCRRKTPTPQRSWMTTSA